MPNSQPIAGTAPRLSFDLSAVAKELEKRAILKSVRVAIQNYQSVASVLHELQSVAAALDTLGKIDSEKAVSDWQILGGALLMQAVIVYARATHTTGKARWPVHVLRAYNAEQIASHKDIIDLRDWTFAHFSGGKGAFGEGWHVEKALLVLGPDVTGVSYIWSSYTYNGRVASALTDLLGSAMPYVNERLKTLETELWRLLDEQIRASKDFRELIRQHPIDVTTLFEGIPPLDELVAAKTDITWRGYDPPIKMKS